MSSSSSARRKESSLIGTPRSTPSTCARRSDNSVRAASRSPRSPIVWIRTRTSRTAMARLSTTRAAPTGGAHGLNRSRRRATLSRCPGARPPTPATPATANRIAEPMRPSVATVAYRADPDRDGHEVRADLAERRSDPGRNRSLAGRQRERGEHRLVAELGQEEGAGDCGDQPDPDRLAPARAPCLRPLSSSPRSVQIATTRNAMPATTSTTVSGSAAPTTAPIATLMPWMTAAAMTRPARPAATGSAWRRRGSGAGSCRRTRR